MQERSNRLGRRLGRELGGIRHRLLRRDRGQRRQPVEQEKQFSAVRDGSGWRNEREAAARPCER